MSFGWLGLLVSATGPAWTCSQAGALIAYVRIGDEQNQLWQTESWGCLPSLAQTSGDNDRMGHIMIRGRFIDSATACSRVDRVCSVQSGSMIAQLTCYGF